jgi:NAD(P)H-dependent FMN reductase
MKIAVIVGTTRDERVTARLANWVYSQAQKLHPEVTFNLVDLKDYDIPFINDEPWDPNRQLGDGTKAWLTTLAESDGYVVVTAEYNHGIPAVLKNALDFTNGEMRRKPAAIVSHGVVGGARSDAHLRLVLNSTIGVVPVPNDVTFFGKVADGIGEDDTLEEPFAVNDKKLSSALSELVWYTQALKEKREA